MEITNTLLHAIAAVNAPSPKFMPDLSEQDAIQQANVLKALADPTRLRILSLLAKYGGVIVVHELEDCFTLSQPTLSFHLKRLHDVGLIACHKKGLYAYYYVVHEVLQRARVGVENLLGYNEQ